MNSKIIYSKAGFLKACLLAFTIVIQTGCGGGETTATGPGDIIGTGITGIAATGTALANATVTIKSKTGAVKTGTTASDGKFQINDLADNGPYLMRANLSNGEYLYSVAHKGADDVITRNIHPYTDLIIRNWFETQGLDIDAVFAGTTPIANIPDEQSVNKIKDEIQAIVAQILENNNVASGFDLLSTPFNADSTGFDLFLDNTPVIINNNQITVIVNNSVTINNTVTNIQNLVINGVDLNTDFTSTADTPPTTPENVRALPASNSEIMVVWDASSDDKGVAGYNVYRNGSLVATTPYPVFSDTGLVASTNYSYEVEAIDGRAQVSILSAASASVTVDTPDTTAPPAPASAAATASGNTINLSWTQTQINDVAGFRIFRGAAGNATTLVATITTSTYDNFNLASATEFCYRVEAYDGAGNTSAQSNETCATTGGVIANPSSVALSSASFQVSEIASSITITVNRSGDISQAISVDYKVENGTAVDGQDFTAATGTLNWAAIDTTAKTFSVQILTDSATESDETVNLSLLNPSANTSLGANATAILTIKDSVTAQCVDLQDTNISQNTSLNLPCYNVNSDISVQNAATLTIQPGVMLKFAAGKELRVAFDGALNAVGTPAAPIIFTGAQQTPGYWDGINYFNSNNANNELKYVTVEYGGAGAGSTDANLEVNSTTRIKLSNTTLRQSANYGVSFSNNAIIDLFANNTITTNEGAPVRIPANEVGKLDSQSSYTGNVANREYISIFESSDIDDDQTWQALNVPYKLHNNSLNAVLTIEPGSTLIFRQGGNFRIERTGTLIARGTAVNNIIFTGENKTPGSWHGLQFTFSGTANELDHVSVEYAGGTNGNGKGAVTLFSSPGRLKIHNTVISDSLQYGLDVDNAAHILDISNVSFINSVDGSVLINPNLVGKLDTNSTYNDPIVFGTGDFVTDQTIKNLGVPYYVGSNSVRSSIIIEEGTTLSFAASGGFSIDAPAGSLTAIGTTLPITFTGRQQVSGYWKGLQFFTNSISNKLDNCIVEYAGAPGGNTQGLVGAFFSSTIVDVTNSTLQHSATNGLWLHDSTTGTHTGNTFIDILSGTNIFIENP
jgi:hypothetical protein